jgi:arsenate reductase (thioredoxin)
VFSAATIVLIALTTGAGVLTPQQTMENSTKTPTVLFMCPHGAAKSVLASAYFRRLARERGLSVHVQSAGTEPDPVVSPTVAAHLAQQGFTVPTATPRKVTPQDLKSADVVISIGCDLAALPAPRGKLVRWDEVPALSDDFARADEAIRKRVIDLVDELVRASQNMVDGDDLDAVRPQRFEHGRDLPRIPITAPPARRGACSSRM